MALCCPQGRGCNAPESGQPCLLDLYRRAAAALPEASLALDRWEEWQTARERGCRRSEWRFRMRAYERARADALCALLMYAHTSARRRGPRRAGAARAQPTPRRSRRRRRGSASCFARAAPAAAAER